jgi:mono/diheme cytochrome c family protein
MKQIGLVLALTLASAACAYPAPESGLTEAPAPTSLSEADHHRLAFVQAACGGCHAVEAPGLSPNPASPPFADIANRRGLTRDTLVTWLTDAHNYPEVMDFDLDTPQVGQIADYILTLRSENYKPVPE